MNKTLEDIFKEDIKELDARAEERRKDVANALACEIGKQAKTFDISEIIIKYSQDIDDGNTKVSYKFLLQDGYSDSDYMFWKWDESIERLASKIVDYISYIEELRMKYPVLAKQNDHIQKFRDFTRNCKIKHNGYTYNGTVHAELCGYLKLPNTTSCSCGGGDYELRRTPGRVKDFNDNIDTLCLFLSDCIAELRTMKLKEDVVSDEVKA